MNMSTRTRTHRLPLRDAFGPVVLLFLVGGGLLAAGGTFLPYVRFVTLGNGFTVSTVRNAWQFGSNRDVSFAGGPAILLSLLFHAYGERNYYVRLRNPGRTFRQASPFVSLVVYQVVTIALILMSWPGTWSALPNTSYSRGPGGWLGLVGVLMTMSATGIQFWRSDRPA